MKKYSKEWKINQTKKHGGWAQKHGEIWKWHYIKYDTEFAKGKYFYKRDAVLSHQEEIH